LLWYRLGDYHVATGKIPIEAQVQQAWYFALHPEGHASPELAQKRAC
jgi:hypothetical protein